MRSKARIALSVAVALIIATVALWYFESPVWTLRNMKAAAEANDAGALNAYIDYPALREDLKAQLTSRMMAEAQKEKTGVGALGVALGSALVGPIIDGLVSPAGIRAALIANHDEQTSGGAEGAVGALKLPQKPLIVRRNLSEFLVTTKGGSGGGLIFKRHGLSWRLSGIELPPDTKP